MNKKEYDAIIEKTNDEMERLLDELGSVNVRTLLWHHLNGAYQSYMEFQEWFDKYVEKDWLKK